MNRRTHNRHNAMTIACWPLASGSKREKMMIISIFSFSHIYFSTIRAQFHHLRYLNLLSAKPFNLDQSKTLLFGKELQPLPDDKISDLQESKAFADDKLNATQNIKFVFYEVEKIVGNGEMLFLLFPQCFQKAFFLWAIKFIIVE